MSTKNFDRQQVPAIEGLFTWTAKEPQLIGSRCRSCRSVSFPSGRTCNNPHCTDKDVEEVLLSRSGKLYSYTVQCYAPPPPYHPPEPFVPFGIGMVELPEGIRVVGMMTQCDVKDLNIDMDVVLVAEKLYEDEQGNEVMGWKWKPV